MSDRTGHSILGASGNHRWLQCPGSVALTEKVCPENESSDAAREGTAAHSWAATCLEDGKDAWEFVGATTEVEGHTYECDEEMVAGIQLYLDTVSDDPSTDVDLFEVETPVHFDALHPELWGTLDCAVVSGQLLRVYDFKYGKGIFVEAEGNTQLLQYGASYLHSSGVTGVKEIEFVIVQPRIPCDAGLVRRWKISIDDLHNWVEDVLHPGVDAVEAARDEPGRSDAYKDGDHCGFCPVFLQCPLKKDQFLEDVKAFIDAGEPDVDSWSPDAIGNHLQTLARLETYKKKLTDKAYALLKNGTKVPGFKLVAKDARRSWKDGAEAALNKKWGDKVYERVLLSPAQLEKAVAGGGAFVAEWCEKRSSGTTMAPADSPKPAIEVADLAEQFGDMVE